MGEEALPVLKTNAPFGEPQATAPAASKDAEISGAPASFLVPALWALLQARKAFVMCIKFGDHMSLRASSSSVLAGTNNDQGLPDIIGSISAISDAYSTQLFVDDVAVTGAFTKKMGTKRYVGSGDTGSLPISINFNASNSNKIYGKSNSVIPPSVNLLIIIYLGK